MKKLVCALTFLAAGAANAGLIGDTVSVELLDGSTSYATNTNVVAAGEEGNFFGNQYYDFGDMSFDIRSTSSYCGMSCGGQLITLKLTNLDFGADLMNVAFSSSLSGVNVSFGSNFVSFSWLDQALTPTTYLSAKFETASVPEPSSLALLGAGLFGLVLARKKNAA